MTVTRAPDSPANVEDVRDALAYEAPFLIEKLKQERIIDSTDEGQRLFMEVKRFLVLVHVDVSRIWMMHSLRVDEVWHHFILFTRQYMAFCDRFFGRYMPHSPSNAPEVAAVSEAAGTFTDFQHRYHEFFGEPLPDMWYDEKSVVPHRRVLNDNAGILSIRDEGEKVSLLAPSGVVLLSVNEVAKEALTFIARTGAFYVREVPGLDGDEQVALVATMVESNILRVAA